MQQFIFSSRYLELSPQDRAKIEGTPKVAKKLERLQSQGNSNDSGSLHSECDNFSEDSSVDGIGDYEENSINNEDYYINESNCNSFSDPPSNNSPTHWIPDWIPTPDLNLDGNSDNFSSSSAGESSAAANALCKCSSSLCACHKRRRVSKFQIPPIPVQFIRAQCSNSATQTLSTGDIVITKVYFEDTEAKV